MKNLCVIALAVLCCATTAWGAPMMQVQNLPALRAQQIVDVRPEFQYIGWDSAEGPGGHIAGAIDFPASWLDMTTPSALTTELLRRGLNPTLKTVLYDNGTASDAIVKKYTDAGFKDVVVLDGGIAAYVKAGLPVSKLPGYEMFVHPQWVQDLVEGKKPAGYSGKKYAIIEVYLTDKEKSAYEQGHIPGAIAADVSLNSVPGPRVLSDYEAIPLSQQLIFFNRQSDEFIKKRLDEMGITPDTLVIFYASAPATTAAMRMGLMMRYAGVKDVRFLNGGRPLWELEKRPMQAGSVAWQQGEFGLAVPQNPEVVIDYEEELAIVNDPKGCVASIRSWEEYLCQISGYTYIGMAGDVGNSRFGYAGSDPYAMEDYRNLDNTMFNYELMAERWARWGITPDKKVSFHCGTGWRASETYFYADAMGWPDIRVYDGGWYEWHKMEGSPRKLAGLPADAPEVMPQSYFPPRAE